MKFRRGATAAGLFWTGVSLSALMLVHPTSVSAQAEQPLTLKDALVVQARDLLKQTALLNARERPVQEVLATLATSVTPAEPALAPTPEPASLLDDVNYSELRRALESWRAAWSKRDVDTYLDFYAPNFVPSTSGNRDAWKEKRKAVLGRASEISVEISDLTVTITDTTHATMVFGQIYRATNYRDVVTKTLQWVRVGERWLITRESTVTPVSGSQ